MTKLKQGHYYSRISYGKIEHESSTGYRLRNEQGFSWSVGKEVLENEIVNSSDSFEEEIKVPKTELARIFVEETGDRIFTVCFEKKTNGEERVLRGRRKRLYSYLGMSDVIDMELEDDPEKDYDTRMRKVHHDGLRWLILDNVKYIKK